MESRCVKLPFEVFESLKIRRTSSNSAFVGIGTLRAQPALDWLTFLLMISRLFKPLELSEKGKSILLLGGELPKDTEVFVEGLSYQHQGSLPESADCRNRTTNAEDLYFYSQESLKADF